MEAEGRHDHHQHHHLPQVELHSIITTATGHENPGEEGADAAAIAKTTKSTNLMWWVKVLMYAAIIIVCQSAYVLLARLYFVKGGNSKWLSTISQIAGFPILIPYFLYSNFIVPRKHSNDDHHQRGQIPPSKYGTFYLIQGLLLGGSTLLYTVGLDNLPVSTSSLIASSQLAFNAFFSYFINSQKFTPYITNSLFLLTVSSVLLVFGGDNQGSSSISKGKYVLGFLCTLAAQVGFGLYLTISEYAFKKVRSFRIVMNMLVYQGMVATGMGLIGLFASGEWRSLKAEMDGYEMGKASYVLTLSWTAVNWQIMAVGTMGLVFEVSSVFSASVGAVGLPLTPILAVVMFHDKMTGVKVVAMVLAVWGFLSYIYQQYLDDRKIKSAVIQVQDSNSNSNSTPTV